MTTSISNTNQETCVICQEDYQEEKIFDVTKVVELACHHFYHIGCIAQSLRHQENGQRDLTCCYCTQKVALSTRSVHAFANQEVFQERLEEIREEYNYDDEVIEAVSAVADLNTSLNALSISFPLNSDDAIANQENAKKLTNAIFDLVIKNEMIKEDLKVTVLRILSAMVLGTRALRSVYDEARSWKSIPFEHWPRKIKEEGVLVRYEDEDIRIRISANQLKKVVDKIFVDALVSHYRKKAENFLQSARSWAPWILGGAAVTVLAAKKL
ncbi:hypothetical protein RHABOEDO_000393 [Candidatus Rhabdochlamydia oedothoracis]|uniref:RING-type domain-containing protein n=1 Tax=Candidatus Rhabdochlamydia oedothoracis TaxID=2720720 RepID=A0ABX8UZH5_9BACT|nr:RING-H2 finger protein [Candidatus Rhabdochlamydia oedothoracis]QYF48266.1 hypothetical protein RHABOEDO_000393 [Candidatus Rhabdochlamydia oedothoracis]